MATFEETVLLRTPLLFARCKEPVASSTIADYSGNGNDLDVVAGTLIFGQLSGVETDPLAKSIYIPGGFANNIGEIQTPPPELLFTGNFTIACFAKNEATFGSQYLAARGGIANSNTAGIHFRSIGSSPRTLQGVIVTTDGIDNTATTVTASVSHLVNTWNFHVFIRNGSVLRLYTNGVLVGENATAPTDSLLLQATNRLKFGAAGNNLAPMQGWAGELIICDFAWTQADVLEVFESAINAIFLHGRADANPTGILRSEFEPDPIGFPFRHNWAETLIERISFRSAISQTVNGIEEGVSERVAPRREFEFTQVLRTSAERRRFRALLWANQHAKWFVPVRQHAERLRDALLAGATTTTISTEFRDYEVDSWIGFRQISASGEIEHSEVRLISSLSPLTFEPLVNNYVANRSIAYPVKRALLRSSVSGTGHTDTIEEWTLTARLLPEDESLNPNRVTPYTPTIKYRDVEVFNGLVWGSNDWSEKREYEVERRLSETDFETSLIELDSDTSGASETFTYRMILDGLEAVSRFLGWYYERAGALIPLWVPTMQEDFSVLSATSQNRVFVSGTSYTDAYALAESRRDLAFVYHDGTMALRRVLASEVVGTDELLTLDATPPSLTNLRCVSLLKYVRLDADQLELVHETDSTVIVAWRFRELLHTPEGTGRSSLSPSASLSASISPSASASPSASESPSLSPSLSPSPSASVSPSGSVSPSASESPSSSQSPSASPSPTPSSSESPSPSASESPSSSESLSPSPSASESPSVSPSPSASPSA